MDDDLGYPHDSGNLHLDLTISTFLTLFSDAPRYWEQVSDSPGKKLGNLERLLKKASSQPLTKHDKTNTFILKKQVGQILQGSLMI